MPVPTTIREPARIDDPFGRETGGAPPETGRVRRAGGRQDYPALSVSGAVAGIGDIILCVSVVAIIIDSIIGEGDMGNGHIIGGDISAIDGAAAPSACGCAAGGALGRGGAPDGVTTYTDGGGGG